MVKIKRRKIELDMDDHVFVTDGAVIETFGVTACIALTVRGQFFDEDDELIEFCGIWHWSGNRNPKYPLSGLDILNDFFERAQEDLEFESDTILQLHELSFIGGEIEQRDEVGELLLSGTEKEVNSLKKAIENLDDLDYSLEIDPSNITWHNFITRDDMHITVRVGRDCIGFEVIDDKKIEQPESTNQFKKIPF